MCEGAVINMENIVQFVAVALAMLAVCGHAVEYDFSSEQGDDEYNHHHDADHELDYHSEPAYKFDYAVRDGHSGDEKSQWEERDGDTVRGGYSLTEPDGRVRHVEYTADKEKGFSAVVRHADGHARHPHVYGDAADSHDYSSY